MQYFGNLFPATDITFETRHHTRYTSMNIIAISNLSKRYGRSIQALADFSLAVERGTIMGLIGPNGAGKTTLIKSILGLAHADAGEIAINGITGADPAARASIGFLQEKFNFFPTYTARNALAFFAALKKPAGVAHVDIAGMIDTVARTVMITELLDRKIKTFSKGELQKVGIAQALLYEPDLLILDEPFSGLDPIITKELKDIILAYRAKGKTVFFSSHILGDVAQLCDRVAIINKGVLVRECAVGDLTGDLTLEDAFYNIITGKN